MGLEVAIADGFIPYGRCRWWLKSLDQRPGLILKPDRTPELKSLFNALEKIPMITNQQGAMALSLLLTGGGLATGLTATEAAA
jgi:hypothetical protein